MLFSMLIFGAEQAPSTAEFAPESNAPFPVWASSARSPLTTAIVRRPISNG